MLEDPLVAIIVDGAIVVGCQHPMGNEMLSQLQQSVNRILRKYTSAKIPIRWIRRNKDSWLTQQFPGPAVRPGRSIYSHTIETLAEQTNAAGPQPLWDGYAGNNVGGPTRTPDQVRTKACMGEVYTLLVQKRRPEIIVEFGTAFGVSGMYFLAGLEYNRAGRLLTFEPNAVWANLARNNLAQISNRFDLTIGTFEENIDSALPRSQRIDMALIDAIHTRQFVIPQLDIVVARSRRETIVILDDINFSDNMSECWDEVSTDRRFAASAVLGSRVGILELD